MIYLEHFGLNEPPFSIAPNPRYLYLTEQHQEALAHLTYGLGGDGGFILLTGEVGTGKTTISRKLLEELPDHIDLAWIVNPRLSVEELLAAICDELGIEHGNSRSVKQLTDLLNAFLLEAHAGGRNVLLMIDEAQNLSPAVLEELRLLTNLETSERKLLQIALLGQPELKEMLARTELRQLAQRITARYHLQPLASEACGEYIRHRLSVAGCNRPVFTPAAVRSVHRLSNGTPRLINMICDRAMLGVYSQNASMVLPSHVRQASRELLGETTPDTPWFRAPLYRNLLLVSLGIAVASGYWLMQAATTVVHESKAEVTAKNEAESITPPATQPAPSSNEKNEATETESAANIAVPMFDADPWQGIEQAGSYELAFATLSSLWLQAPILESPKFCSELAVDLSCLVKPADIGLLQAMNRPALISVSDTLGNKHYAVLRRIEEKIATLQLAEQQWQVSVDELSQRWESSVTVLWRKPPGVLQSIKAGNSGKSVAWLSDQLDRIQGSMIPPHQSERMDQVLVARVESFQQDEGIEADGVAGFITLMRINERIGLPVIKLRETH